MESNNKSSSLDDEKKLSNVKERKEFLKEKTSEKIKKFKELIKAIGLTNMFDILKYLDNIESILDLMSLGELEKVAKEIQDEITISIENDDNIKSKVKLQISNLLNGEDIPNEIYTGDYSGESTP